MIAIRGAVQLDEDSPDAIALAVEELCEALTEQNALSAKDIVSAIFTLTPDLRSSFPALAARRWGWAEVPMMCAQELDVPGALPRVCRVMLHVNGAGPPRHVYLRGAKVLRPDLHLPSG